MKRTKALLAVVLALGTAFLSGCLFVSAPPTGIIEGFVTDHLSGEPVVGTRVTAYPQGGDAPIYWVSTDYYGPSGTTNSAGFYRVVVPEGLYTVEVRRDGHATSRTEGVKVGSTTRLDFVQRPVFNPNWPLEPPTITVDGIVEGGTYAYGPISVKVDATGPNHIQHIYAAFGKMPGAAHLTAPRAVFSDTPTTGTFTIDPATYGVAGETTFEVVVYDMNDNRTHLIYRVVVTPDAAGAVSPPLAPTAAILTYASPIGVLVPARTALAVTLSRKIAYFGAPTEPSAAPPGGNLFVELRWLRSLDEPPAPDLVIGNGYRIYRRLAGEANFRLLYTVNATGAATYIYRDSTPDLLVGLTATYRITYFRGTAESAPLEAETTPIGAWDVRPLSPANDATGVDLLPTFTWEPINPPPGATLIYSIRIWDTPLGVFVVDSLPLVNVTSWTYTGIPGGPFERLQPHRMYQWQVRNAIAYDDARSAVSLTAFAPPPPAPPIPPPPFPTLAHPDMPAFTTRDW